MLEPPQENQSSDTRLAAALEAVSRLEQQLREAQKMEAVGLLAGGVAHDFNNLLTVIIGYSDMLLTTSELPDPSRELVAVIRAAGNHAAALARWLLTFSRRAPLEPRVVDLNECVRELGALVRRLLPVNIEFATVLETHPKMVLADPVCLQHALLNLVVNSRDAMSEGGKIEIRTTNLTAGGASSESHAWLPAGSYVLLIISDTGSGMDDETKRRLFEPLYSTKPAGAGTGLGLSMVQYIVKLSGGFLSVESEAGKGTTVRIAVPCCAGEKTQEIASFEGVPAKGYETILIAENSPDVRRFLRTMLEGLGYSVLEAASAREAATLSSGFAGRIDLLVAGVALADSTGIELARRLREPRPGLPVLYISGYTEDTAIVASVQKSGSDFLSKPFTLASLAERVRRILDRQEHRRILFVDDDAAVAGFAARVLRGAGYEVLVAENGKVALRAVEIERPDLVVTDLVMPECEGLETITILRKLHPSVYVIATSGAFGGDFLKIAAALGAHAAMPKPFSAEKLLETVRAVLRTR